MTLRQVTLSPVEVKLIRDALLNLDGLTLDHLELEARRSVLTKFDSALCIFLPEERKG